MDPVAPGRRHGRSAAEGSWATQLLGRLKPAALRAVPSMRTGPACAAPESRTIIRSRYTPSSPLESDAPPTLLVDDMTIADPKLDPVASPGELRH